jgi:DnaJ like chaperone protein
MSFGKWIAGGLGFALGGPIGAVLGFAVGSMLDGGQQEPPPKRRSGPRAEGGSNARTTSGDMAISLVVLTAAVMKADGKATQKELDHVRQYFLRQFGQERTAEMLNALREILQRDIPLGPVCEQIRQHAAHPLRLQLVHYLIGIAFADGRLDPGEREMIRRIATYLGISEKDLASMSAMFSNAKPADHYRILEIDPSATDEEVKRAYRRMAMKHHPDKVVAMGEEFQKAAASKFRSVQEAYEHIRVQRGFK